MDQKIKYCKDSSLLRLIDRVNTIPIQTAASFFFFFPGMREAETRDSGF